MTGMNVVEFFQDEVQFPYGGIRRVSAALVGTLSPSPNQSFSFPNPIRSI